MSIPLTWMEKIELAFQNGCPNGYLEAWDEERYWGDLQRVCDGLRVFNCTDFNYSYCNHYEARDTTKHKQFFFEMTIRVSFVVDAYSLFWSRLMGDRSRSTPVLDSAVPCGPQHAMAVRAFFDDLGYTEVGVDWAEIAVPNVQLQLAKHATLGKCLFDDYA